MIKEQYGVTDLPCAISDGDVLGNRNYIVGLEEFVRNCPTPMSIALQGGWGTGKTSFLNTMINDFEKFKEITPVYFNTWQYSQFNMSDNLYASFISNIVSELEKKNLLKKGGKEFVKNVFKVTAFLTKHVIEEKTGVNLNDLESELVNKEEEKASIICDLKEQFAKIVDEAKGENTKGRVVIFVDDLDRLSPEIAVELLEVIKLFMDVPHCIFVLAIDYEVVINGVRKKFGSDMTEEKCKRFFDKIIQLPFHMPVESYNIQGMLQEIFNDKMDKYINPISNFVKRTVGSNPRTLKRVINSFCLLQIIAKKRANISKIDDECQAALLFVSLVVQTNCDDAYKKMLDCEDAEEIKGVLNQNAENDIDSDADIKINETLSFTKIVIDAIGAEIENKENIYEKFFHVLELSSMTSVSRADSQKEFERKKAMKVTRICLEGKEKAVKNPTYAQIETYKYVLEKNKDRIKEFMQAYPRILTTNEEEKNSYYRVKKPLNMTLDGKTLYIGTSSSSADKIIYTKLLCEYMDMPSKSVTWYDGDDVVFNND